MNGVLSSIFFDLAIVAARNPVGGGNLTFLDFCEVGEKPVCSLLILKL